jgi:N-acetyl-gamma-glutamyl-phosphate reductase
MITVGIVGGTGYTGVELLRLLAQHPEARVRAITSRKDAGTSVAHMFPSLRGHYDLTFSDPQDADLRGCDVVFFATPHGVAMAQARELLSAGARIIDLAADFRLRRPRGRAGSPPMCGNYPSGSGRRSRSVARGFMKRGDG